MKWSDSTRTSAAALAPFGSLAFRSAAEAAVTSNCNTNCSGLFTVAGNWNNGVPGHADTAVFNRGLAVIYSVTF